MTFTHALATNNYGTAKFIVDASAANGTHTTIASAITSASSGDTIFIRPGTYTENLTLKDGVNLTAYNTDFSFGTVKIIGKLTLTYSGVVSISGIRLQTNSDFIIESTGSNTGTLYLFNCSIVLTNNTGISSSNSNATIILETCTGDLGTTGIAIFSISGGSVNLRNSYFTNTGASTTANSASAGSVVYLYSSIFNPTSITGTGAFNGRWSTLSSSTQNVTVLTCNSSGAMNAQYCNFSSGSAAAITITSGTFQISHSLVNSSNGTSSIDGAGTINYDSLAMTNTGDNITTTTKTPFNNNSGPISFDGGTNYLSVYTEGSFTPTIVGQTSAGAGTYTSQIGRYTRIGNRVFYQAYIVWTAHTGTGNMQMGGLPFTSSATTNSFASQSIWISNITYTANSQVAGYVNVNATTIQFQEFASGGAAGTIALDTAGSVILSGHYHI